MSTSSRPNGRTLSRRIAGLLLFLHPLPGTVTRLRVSWIHSPLKERLRQSSACLICKFRQRGFFAVGQGFHELHAIGIFLFDCDAHIVAILAFRLLEDNKQPVVSFTHEAFVLEQLNVRHSVSPASLRILCGRGSVAALWIFSSSARNTDTRRGAY